MGPPSPGPAEIIRASQRDKEFILRLKQDIDEIILELLGQRVWIRCQRYSQYFSGVFYYTVTNLMGFQTLGEEYVGVVQVDRSRRAIPSRKALSLMIFSQVLGAPFLSFVTKIIENFQKRQRNMSNSSPENEYLKELLDTFLGVGKLFQRFHPLLTQLHLALFYMNGKFLHFSKRLCGIQYLLVRKYYGNNDEVSKKNLKYLMYMSILNLTVCTVHDFYHYFTFLKNRSTNFELLPSAKINLSSENELNAQPSSSTTEVDSSKKCSLCLELRTHSSATPCGHVFCWACIIDWLRTEGACPICREPITPSRIVPLQNLV
ncbi:unnamed protein product [Orchesella dallaii]|uniref:RING-type E3 ubiquitin transferase n=1 Tax=Orchesella dallaii TaxID=48710 RepID=A0ABP1QPQ4_9HEXA